MPKAKTFIEGNAGTAENPDYFRYEAGEEIAPEHVALVRQNVSIDEPQFPPDVVAGPGCVLRPGDEGHIREDGTFAFGPKPVEESPAESESKRSRGRK